MLTVIGCQTETEPPNENGPPDIVEGFRVGNLAPDFKLKNMEGQTVSLSDFRGQPVLVNFWATWCHYCLQEMPYLEQVYEDWAGEGLVMLAIDKGESKGRVEAFLENRPLSMLVLLDIDESVSRKYMVLSIPATFFIDKDGIIQEKVVGAFPNVIEIEKRLVKMIP